MAAARNNRIRNDFKPWHSHIAISLVCLALGACQSPVPAPVPVEPTAPAPVKPAAPVTPVPEPIVALPAPNPPPKLIARHFPESSVLSPDLDRAPARIEYSNRISTRKQHGKFQPGWKYREDRNGRIVGFELSNHGGNAILPPRYDSAKNLFYTRDFQFHFEGRARQDIHLMVSDWVPSQHQGFRLSGILNSVMMFFPRRYLPAIVHDNDRIIVTLPTGEDVFFDAETLEIVGGVLFESPVDLSPDRNRRKFPSVHYKGAGLWLRADSRGSDPRLGTIAHVSNGTARPSCAAGNCEVCKFPARDLWRQSGAVNFKFPTDTEFDQFLAQHCNLAIPDVGLRKQANEISLRP